MTAHGFWRIHYNVRVCYSGNLPNGNGSTHVYIVRHPVGVVTANINGCTILESLAMKVT